MNIPGFTAEDSLYKSSVHYIYRVSNHFRTYQAGTVIPQMPKEGGSSWCINFPLGGNMCMCNSILDCQIMSDMDCKQDGWCNGDMCWCFNFPEYYEEDFDWAPWPFRRSSPGHQLRGMLGSHLKK